MLKVNHLHNIFFKFLWFSDTIIGTFIVCVILYLCISSQIIIICHTEFIKYTNTCICHLSSLPLISWSVRESDIHHKIDPETLVCAMLSSKGGAK